MCLSDMWPNFRSGPKVGGFYSREIFVATKKSENVYRDII